MACKLDPDCRDMIWPVDHWTDPTYWLQPYKPCTQHRWLVWVCKQYLSN